MSNTNLIGFFHIPIAALVMGLSMLLAARRFGIMAIIVIGTALACRESFLDISPVIWLSFPILCFSVLIGAGMQVLASAGFSDRRWVLFSAIVVGVLAAVTLLLATEYFQTFLGLGVGNARRFTDASKMFGLGTVAVAILFFMARAKLRLLGLRWAILCSAMALDIFSGARSIVDSMS